MSSCVPNVGVMQPHKHTLIRVILVIVQQSRLIHPHWMMVRMWWLLMVMMLVDIMVIPRQQSRYWRLWIRRMVHFMLFPRGLLLLDLTVRLLLLPHLFFKNTQFLSSRPRGRHKVPRIGESGPYVLSTTTSRSNTMYYRLMRMMQLSD